MGVLGFAPFLQKTCPQVIKNLPNRLKDLAGKTIVIDGTLVTQRLHFAPMPHEYRHVLGWYRLVQELRESGARAICVFDGKQRSPAKADEIERRRNVRRLDAFRGSIERDRLRRLGSLTELLKTCRSLDPQERRRATTTLHALLTSQKQAPPPIPAPFYVAGELSSLEPSQDLHLPSAYTPPLPSDDPLGYFTHEDIDDIIFHRYGEPDILISDTRLDSRDVTQNPNDLSFDQLSLDSYNMLQPSMDELPLASRTSLDVPSCIAALYLSYRQSIFKMDGLSTSDQPSSAIPLTDDVHDMHTEAAMSKSQHQLTIDEGRLWETLAGPTVLEDGDDSPQTILAALAEKSSLIAQSYLRRNNPPTEETYIESKAILQTMGVPWVETTGPYEAEALASSLVLKGFGDYVATEDTDVLVYEAPMLRHITSRRDPLTVISGSEVRAALELDRAQYIDFALLLGTDFSQRIKNVGPQRALKFIRERGSIEGILEAESQYPPRQSRETYLEHVRAARVVFSTLPPVPDALKLLPGEYREEEVSDMLRQYGLLRFLGHDGWDYTTALDGNYFHDNPAASRAW
ncbi:PIN domain-like protein [Artomyces pyxidatus]|uniref:PIN domain-like protein n=1 Tax=Artomyces pyxidatus TaxID=48021 RepID=A0ACB8T7W5_9AGAM|nr:PIN domain-like protein [Artomyces pyxidatus]